MDFSTLDLALDILDLLKLVAEFDHREVDHTRVETESAANWGAFRLPRVTTKHQARYTEGHHFIMRFDSSGSTTPPERMTWVPALRAILQIMHISI
jgi:hypothetical protein